MMTDPTSLVPDWYLQARAGGASPQQLQLLIEEHCHKALIRHAQKRGTAVAALEPETVKITFDMYELSLQQADHTA